MTRWALVGMLGGCSQAMSPVGDETDETDETGAVAETLLVNEILASNDSSYADENGEFDDWFELYNPGDAAVDLEGWIIADAAASHTIPGALVVPAGGFVVLWCDDAPEQGVAHLPFKLSGDGDTIAVTAPDGAAMAPIPFEPQTTDVSWGRSPDGSETWTSFDAPTPGASNG